MLNSIAELSGRHIHLAAQRLGLFDVLIRGLMYFDYYVHWSLLCRMLDTTRVKLVTKPT
jgi:hypothetical protein